MAAVTEMCRVTIVTPMRWADVVLPAAEPLADLLPALLDHVADAELVQQQVVLQRLGHPPLSEARSLAAHGVLDGETLYLNPVGAPLPLLDFDDSIAGLGTGSDELPNRWQPLYTRRMLLALAAAPIGLGWFLLVNRQTLPQLNAGLALLTTVLMIVGAGVTSRAWNDKVMALMLGTGAVAFAAAAGYLTVRSAGPVEVLTLPVGLAVAAGVFSVACIVDRALGSLAVGFAGVAYGALLAALAIGPGMVVDYTPKQAVALMLSLTVMSFELVVTLACRLAGIFLPPLPRNAEELEESIEQVPGQNILTLAAQVDQYLTALMWGAAVVVAGCSLFLAQYAGWATVLVLVAAAGCLFRVRLFPAPGQRAALLVAALSGPVALLLRAGWQGQDFGAIWVAVIFMIFAVLLFVGALVLPGRRGLPHYGRAAEIFEILAGVALIPVMLAVLGTYSAARNLR